MPYRSKFREVNKSCEYCGNLLSLNNNQDIIRKNFCNVSCRQRGRYKRGEWTIDRIWDKCNTPEANLKKAHRKEEHPKWILDRTLVKYQRTMTELRDWRKEVFERDDYTCQECGKRGGRLNADHIKSYVLFPSLRRSLENGRTLCVECHRKTPTYARNADKQRFIYV